MIKIQVNNKTRIIRKIYSKDETNLYAEYYGWTISIYPMWGKVINEVYFDNIPTGEFGVDVAGRDGCRIVDDVQPSFEKALIEAIENILLCRPQYGR